jgi:hypothetical protein
MPDGVDDEILKMQHLEAEARARMEERASQEHAEKLKSVAGRMALESQQEIDAAQAQLDAAEAKQAKGRTPGTPPLEAADLLTEGRIASQEAKSRLVKARARLNFALDRLDDAERAAWDALHVGARADAHGQLASESNAGNDPGES